MKKLDIDRDQFVDLYLNQKKSGLEIARLLGIGRTTVSRCIAEFELAPRGNSVVRANKHWGPSAEVRRKLSELGKSQVGAANPNWKGGFYDVIRLEKSKYDALHKWVAEQLGKPRKCAQCGKAGLTRNKIHWANKSGHYLKDTDDWIRLCVPCHRTYDKKLNYREILSSEPRG